MNIRLCTRFSTTRTSWSWMHTAGGLHTSGRLEASGWNLRPGAAHSRPITRGRYAVQLSAKTTEQPPGESPCAVVTGRHPSAG